MNEAGRPPLKRKFSSQFPAAEPDTQPAWGIKAVAKTEPCATCLEPTHFVDTAFVDPQTGVSLHFCSEGCLDPWLDLLMGAGVCTR